ncbi:hypothetical protein FB567DRAFT_318216 [Paraphoma chrysanthemicola]|uniref:Uncharacterized protein n=1 Tax=Paraphoma chrysanthemicola TaxID=798071 RepID=A0A8K0R7R0_9PLEO|nr:hypothetical protein FB567DRAFT_318216 [Paraphoma chrysanthemicola]
MCFHNYTQHNGCGHLGESHTHPWTLCDAALQRLNGLRGPNSPPLSSPVQNFQPPKRASSTRRFFSLSQTLSRSNTTASTSSRRTTSGPPGTPRDSLSSHGSWTPAAAAPATALNYDTLPDHQLLAVRCSNPTRRTHVSREMDVCKVCKGWVNDMRSMLVRYDKTGSIRGTTAFEKFLKPEGEGAGLRDDDLTVPLDDSVNGVKLGARQAIVMGLDESAMGEGGLEALEREMNARRGFY